MNVRVMVGARCCKWVRQRFVSRLASFARMNARMSWAMSSSLVHSSWQRRVLRDARVLLVTLRGEHAKNAASICTSSADVVAETL